MFQCIFRISNRHLSRQVSVSLVDLADRGGVYSEVDERDPDRSSTEDSVRSPEYNSDDSPATWSKKKEHTHLTGWPRRYSEISVMMCIGSVIVPFYVLPF